MGAVLAPSVGMVDTPGLRSSIPQSFFEGQLDQFLGHASPHGVDDDFHGAEVFDTGQIEPAFARRDIGDIGSIDLARSTDIELLAQ